MEINIPLTIILGVALSWTTAFSMTNRFPLRGYRNLGLLACYISPLIFMFISSFISVAVTWLTFALLGALTYTSWEALQNARTNDPDEKSKIGFGNFFSAPFAWPIMIPEAVEYFLAEIGVLNAADFDAPIQAEQNAAEQPATAPQSKPK